MDSSDAEDEFHDLAEDASGDTILRAAQSPMAARSSVARGGCEPDATAESNNLKAAPIQVEVAGSGSASLARRVERPGFMALDQVPTGAHRASE